MTQEELDAQKLAVWLDGDHSQEIDPELLAVLQILQPAFIPEPQTQLDDVLTRVKTGPFGNCEEDQATEDDLSVVETIFSGEIPEPKSQLQDVLARINQGPFVAETKEPVEKSEVEELPDNVIHPVQWWKKPQIAIISAAAIALFILIPSNFEISEEEQANFPVAQEMAKRQQSPVQPPEETEISDIPAPQKTAPAKKLPEKAPKTTKSKEKAETAADMASPPKPMEEQQAPNTAKPQTAVTTQTEIVEQKSVSRGDQAFDTMALEDGIVEKAKAQESLAKENEETISQEMDSELDLMKEKSVADESSDDSDDSVDSLAGAAFTEDMAEDAEAEKLEEEIVEAEPMVDSDELMVVETTTKATRSREARTAKDMLGSLSRKKSAPAQSEANMAASVEEAPSQATDQIQDLLSSTEKEYVRNLNDSMKVLAYAKQFSASKALVILWHASLNQNIVYSIVVLQYSTQFPNGEKQYLRRNYLELARLLEQEGRVEEAQYYRRLAQ